MFTGTVKAVRISIVLAKDLRSYLYNHVHVYFDTYVGGLFDTQPANEYCFTLFNANVTSSVGFDLKYVDIAIQ